MDIKEAYSKYANIDIGDLSNNQKDGMREVLSSTKPKDLKSVEEHRMYLMLLQSYRNATMKDMNRVGTDFLKTLQSLLAVGEDGVYSNSQRFIYELIQNVDDCEYENIEDCRLDIKFEYHTEPGKIILTYNEKGFKPENVFAITGIAEKSKNISADKVEIGEKGIGFKSVFGIAEKVHIESGSFSFELYRDNFIVPIPKYDNYTPIKGTRLTLEMQSSTVQKIYRSMVEQYIQKDAVLNKNPILFLNKLTHLKMFFDGFRYIKFDVQRKEPKMIGNIAFEDDVIVSVDMKDSNSSIDKEYSSKIKCKRYTQSIVYGEEECKSRYGENVSFNKRNHNLIALFPTSLDELKDYKGLMYSFLPTQISITVPVVMHIPFKLDGSREFVDPQGENKWFSFTIDRLVDFLKSTYIHLATIVKQDIITYIPNRYNFFFKRTNEKIKCLQKNELRGNTICLENVFYTDKGTYESADNIVSFAKDEDIENPREIFSLLGEQGELFIPNSKVDMRLYNVRVIENVPALLFKTGLREEHKFSKIADILDKIGKNLDYENLIKECCPIALTNNQVLVISKHQRIYKAINNYCDSCIIDNKLPEIKFLSNTLVTDEKFSNEVQDIIKSADLNNSFEKYLESINFKFYLLKGLKKGFSITAKNGIVVSKSFPMGSFANIVSKYDDTKTFSATLSLRQASDTLNEIDESMSNSEYLKLLRDVRAIVKGIFGKKIYKNYIQLINNAGADKNRFLNELLQNADDCIYSNNDVPSFDMKIDNNKVTVTYNELGFTKHNVRAITAIGESTKKQLLNGKDTSIGEKGIGFKSVFGVAKSVEIHSNGFDFKLTDETPTIPDKCTALKGTSKKGTTLIFDMKSNIKQVLINDKILELCLCLRNLKEISIDKIKINISDSANERTIKIGDQFYYFEKFIYNFEINDIEAIEQRSMNQRIISNEQSIVCYIPKETKAKEYLLYVGLPTAINCKVPLIIDAPFELTTSRDNVIKCKWNNLVRDALYKAILSIMETKKDVLRIDVFKFVRFVSQIGSFSYKTFSESYLGLV